VQVDRDPAAAARVEGEVLVRRLDVTDRAGNVSSRAGSLATRDGQPVPW
jgi:hypothetical protein